MGSLRFVLAFAVAGGHALGFFGFPSIYLYGGEAVQIFFMISGFLIALILRGKYANSANGNWIFYSNRAAKIFVPYLIVLGVTVVLSALFYVFAGNAVSLSSFVEEGGAMSLATWLFALLTNLFILGQEWVFVLIYRSGELLFSLNASGQPPVSCVLGLLYRAARYAGCGTVSILRHGGASTAFAFRFQHPAQMGQVDGRLIVDPIDSWRQARVRRSAIPSPGAATSPIAQPATG